MKQALVEYLINAAWQAPLFAIGALVVTHIAGLSPRARNLAWLGFLIAAVVLPAISIRGPQPARSVSRPVSEMTSETASHAAATANLERAQPSRLLRLELDPRSARWIRLAFVTAAAVGLARLALAAVAAQRLVDRSEAVVLPVELASALEDFGRAHHHHVPLVRQSDAVGSPVVVGAFRPVILAPPRFFMLAIEDQQAALLHEFAHVLRRDYAVNLLSEIAALPLNWHPALHAIKSGVRRSRELACDAMAAAAMRSEEDYARRLLSLAKCLGARGQTPPAAAMAVGLFGKSTLEERLMHLLARKDAEPGGLKAARLGGAAMAAALALAPAVIFRVTPAFAQSSPVLATPPVALTPATMTPVSLAEPASRPAVPPAPPEPPTPPKPERACPDRIARTAMSAAGHGPSLRESVTEKDGHRTFEGVLIDENGDSLRVVTDDSQDKIADSRRQMQDTIHRAVERSIAAQKRIESPEFKQRMADLVARQTQLASIDADKIRKQIDAANAAMKSARVQEELARGQARIAEVAGRESQRAAERVRGEAERSMRDAAREAERDSAREID